MLEAIARWTKSFLTQLTRDAGHDIRWTAMNPAMNTAASRAAHDCDNAALHAMPDKLVP